MAGIIFKWRYLKAGASGRHSENLIRYIAQREGVEKLDDSWKHRPVTKAQTELITQILSDYPDAKDSFEYQDYEKSRTAGAASEFITRAIEERVDLIGKRENYVEYIAKRPRVERQGSHGLFTDDGVPINLSAAAKEVANHKGVVFTEILSLRREDAVRLGYDKGSAWRDLLRSQTDAMAAAMKIPLTDLRWYAAFHNESHHPHVHIVAYSAGREPYMTEQGLHKLKSVFARQIFKQDLLQVYTEQTKQRNTLTQKSRDVLADIIGRINSGSCDNPIVADLLVKLSEQLKHCKGKKVYGYLPQTGRNLVNAVVDELAKDKNIAAMYDLWYEQRDKITSTYRNTPEQRIPLSQNKEFKAIKNAVIQEAMNIAAGHIEMEETPEDSQPDVDEPEISRDTDWDETEPTEPDRFYGGGSGNKKKKSWWTDEYKKARQFFYGTKEILPDFDAAFSLMQTEAKKGNGFAMHDLGKMYLSGLGCEKDEEQAQAWFTKAYHAFIAKEASSKKKDYLAGKILLTEESVKDVHKAVYFLKIAAAQQNSFAEFQLGSLYLRGKDVVRNEREAIRWLTLSAEHGNPYAAQLLHSIKSNQNWSAALGALRLLQHLSRMIQNRLEDERKGTAGMTERKLKRKIDEKKQAHGLRQGYCFESKGGKICENHCQDTHLRRR